MKDGTVIPASKLAEAKDLALQRVREFEEAAVDEERHRRKTVVAPKDIVANLPLTRERLRDKF